MRLLSDHLPDIQLKAESIAPATSYWTNGVGFAFGALTFNEWVMACTLVLGVATFAVNYYFARKRDARALRAELREAEYHRARLAQLAKLEDTE